MKKVGIMQPYFLPYLGYFQLINMVDEFVLYDNIQFTKKGWIHRNRILQNGKPEYFTLPLKKDSDYLFVKDRLISDDFENEKARILRKIEANYRKAPHFDVFFPILQDIFNYSEKNLFWFIYYSIVKINEYLNIQTPIIISSELPEYIESLKGQNKVIAICKETNADIYINSSGGVELYDVEDFAKEGIELEFYESVPFQYPQFGNEFVPFLSIIDYCMFVSKIENTESLKKYNLI